MIWEEWPRVCGHRTLPSLSYAERGNPSQQADGQEAERAGVSWGALARSGYVDVFGGGGPYCSICRCNRTKVYAM